MKEFVWEKYFMIKWQPRELSDTFSLIGVRICIGSAFMVRLISTTALVKQFDMLPIQCRHIEHMHEGVWLKN